MLGSIPLTAMAILSFSRPANIPTGADDPNSAITPSKTSRAIPEIKEIDDQGFSPLDQMQENQLNIFYYYPGGMNKAEAKFCANPLHSSSCAKAKAAATDASNQASKKFPRSTLYQGRGDAFRHCYWSARMTIDMGAKEAQGFGDRHEAYSSGKDKQMDLNNNATGRTIGSKYPTHRAASSRCEYLAKNGKLVTLK